MTQPNQSYRVPRNLSPGRDRLSHFNEENLREFLLALAASGTHPSPSLIKAITKLSGLDEMVVETLFREIFGPPEAALQIALLQETAG